MKKTHVKIRATRDKKANGAHDMTANFVCDYYTYVCLERDTRKAMLALQHKDINEGFGREGWVMLMIYLFDVLIVMRRQIVDCQYIIPQEYLRHIEAVKESMETKVKGLRIEHVTPMITNDLDLLNETLLAAAYIKNIIRNCFGVEVDKIELDKDIQKIDDDIEKGYIWMQMKKNTTEKKRWRD